MPPPLQAKRLLLIEEDQPHQIAQSIILPEIEYPDSLPAKQDIPEFKKYLSRQRMAPEGR